MNRTTFIVIVAALLAGAAASSLLFKSGATERVALHPDDAALVAQGAEIYVEHCAECHGKNLEGQANWRQRDAEGYLPAPPHDETGHTWHHVDALLFQMTKHGLAPIAGADYKTKMPAYADVLSDEEIVAVLSYIKSRWPNKVRARHDRMNQPATEN